MYYLYIYSSLDNTSLFTSIQQTVDGYVLISGDMNGDIKFWDTRGRAEIKDLKTKVTYSSISDVQMLNKSIFFIYIDENDYNLFITSHFNSESNLYRYSQIQNNEDMHQVNHIQTIKGNPTTNYNLKSSVCYSKESIADYIAYSTKDGGINIYSFSGYNNNVYINIYSRL